MDPSMFAVLVIAELAGVPAKSDDVLRSGLQAVAKPS